MAKEKIVRCKVSKNVNGTTYESVRYIPLDIFNLWKLLMTDKHGFKVESDCASLWFDIDGDPNVKYVDTNYERVIRLRLWVYSEEAGMFREITRYFPADEYGQIKSSFLAHYEDYFKSSRFPPRIEETHGVWLKRVD